MCQNKPPTSAYANNSGEPAAIASNNPCAMPVAAIGLRMWAYAPRTTSTRAVSTGSGVPSPSRTIWSPAPSPASASAGIPAATHGHPSKRYKPYRSSSTRNKAGTISKKVPVNSAASPTVFAARLHTVPGAATRNHRSRGCSVHATTACTNAHGSISSGASGASHASSVLPRQPSDT